MTPRKDVDLAVSIRESLMRDDRLSAHRLDVSAVDGVVTLRGTVQSHRRRRAAVDIAESANGCRAVVDELVVEPIGSVSDEEASENVRRSLDAHADITKEVITVTTKVGTVTLNGHVGSLWERTLAEDVALGARGVRSVRNLITVDLAGRIEDEALMRNIQDELKKAQGLVDREIRVAVSGSTAVLSGSVPAPWHRRRAEEIASRFRVTAVRNDIRVGP